MLGKGFFVFVLETLVGQVHFWVFVVRIVSHAGCAQIALVEEINVELLGIVQNCHQSPHSDVELSVFVKQRSFDILLDHPLGVRRLLLDVLDDISDFAK